MISTEEFVTTEEPTEEIAGEAANTETAEETKQPETPAAPSQFDPLAEIEKLQLDPKVKEALKAGFLRQSDYTKKTQEIAEIKREHEQLLAERSQPKEEKVTPNPDEFEYPDDPKEFGKTVEERAVNKALEIFRKEQEAKYAEQAQEQRLNSDIAESEKLDPRLTSDESFAKQIAGLLQVNFAQAIQNGEMSVIEATKRSLEMHKQYEDSMRQKLMDEMNVKAKSKTMAIPSSKGSPLGTATKGGKMSVREAAQLAEEQINSR